MQTFSTKEVRHEFQVDDHQYWLAGVTVDDIEAIAALATLEETEQLKSFRDVLVSRANPKHRTIAQWFAGVPSAPRAVRSLTVGQLSALFVAWSGFRKSATPGESSALPESASITETS